MKTLAGIKFNEKEIEEIKRNFVNKKEEYIVKYDTIYQLFYSQNAGLYTQKIYSKNITKNSVGFTRRGRFMFANAKFVNRLVDFKLVNE
jgi:hypothetical protein